MSDEPRPDEEGASLAMPEPALEAGPEVTFVVPAPPYVSIATDDATAAVPVPEPEVTPRAGPDLTPALDAVAALGVTLGRQLDGLQTLFEREIRAEATREK